MPSIEKTERNQAIIDAHDKGERGTVIAARYGISSQRVDQIVARELKRRASKIARAPASHDLAPSQN